MPSSQIKFPSLFFPTVLFFFFCIFYSNLPPLVMPQWILVRDAGYPYPYGYGYAGGGGGGGYYPSNSCVDRRPDCRTFENICEHPDYKWYMDGCCKNTCDPECRRKDPTDLNWETRRRRFREERDGIGGRGGMGVGGEYRDTERDIERERRNNEAIRRKYLGEIDRNNLGLRQWGDTGIDGGGTAFGLGGGTAAALFPSRSVYPGPQQQRMGQAYGTSELGRWRDDNRWDRNAPNLPGGL